MNMFLDNEKLSVVYCDITTGEFCLCHFDGGIESNFCDLLSRICPSEVLGNADAKDFYNSLPILKFGVYPKFEQYFEYAFEKSKATENIKKQWLSSHLITIDA